MNSTPVTVPYSSVAVSTFAIGASITGTLNSDEPTLIVTISSISKRKASSFTIIRLVAVFN